MSAARHLIVVRAGALTTVQDDGRAGLAHLGVPRSGSLDRAAHHLANRLVGNAESVAVLETTVDGVGLQLAVDADVAVTGALADVSVDGRAVGWSVPVRVRAGQRLEVGRARAGVRSYLAVTGGIAAAPVLGGACRDLLSGLGPPPLAAGERVPLGPPAGPPSAIDMSPYPVPADPAELLVHPGPRADWLSPAGRATLTGATWTVASASNRIALRLTGPAVQRARHDELPSEGLVVGAVQSLPDGGLVAFLADHPTTGGYPVVAVVDPDSLGACAQARPGTSVRLRPTAAWASPAGPTAL
jgi:biotin-dependent carboxylase-like uncharacterized protein